MCVHDGTMCPVNVLSLKGRISAVGSQAETTKDIAKFLKSLNFKEHNAVISEAGLKLVPEVQGRTREGAITASRTVTTSSVQPEETAPIKKQLAAPNLVSFVTRRSIEYL